MVRVVVAVVDTGALEEVQGGTVHSPSDRDSRSDSSALVVDTDAVEVAMLYSAVVAVVDRMQSFAAADHIPEVEAGNACFVAVSGLDMVRVGSKANIVCAVVVYALDSVGMQIVVHNHRVVVLCRTLRLGVVHVCSPASSWVRASPL